ncbi:MAG: leucine-rich repeat domain-containing protein [Bacteroidales bacterium]|nr:leucine-rich repeat domain-containing protein [Bacteroidales bacterium]
MKKYLHLILFLLVFAGFAQAQGPASTANWFGYILPPNPAEYKYISFTMQDLGSVSVASDVIPAVTTATFADGYVWSVNNDNGYNICRSSFDATNNHIEAPEVMVAGIPYVNDMAYNPADGLVYIITGEHLKSFNPADPSNIQDHGVIEHDGFNLAIDMEGNAYMISSWGEFGMLNLSNAQLTVINPIDLPIKMAFDMLTGELFGVYYGNLYQLDPNTGAYTNLGALQDGGNGYDPTCLFMAYSSNPTEFTVGNLNYRVNDDHVSVTVIGHVDGYEATGDLIIPESVSYGGNNYAVTTIGNTAFMYCFYLTSLTIPNSVTTIEEGAFAYCSGFTGDLVIPNSVVTIEPSAFFTCYGFDGDLIIGNSVSTIGAWAFNSCDGMTGVLNIPSNVASIGEDAFVYCKFQGMVVDPENPNYDSRNDCNALIATSANELAYGCKNTVIPNTVTAIGKNAFKGITGMTSIEIPDSVISIGENAFAFCIDLTGDLVIPNSVETIGESAFFQCEGLDGKLVIGESVSYIGDMAFRKCSHILSAVSLATIPPVLGNDLGGMAFAEFGIQTLTVPCGCVEAYQNSQWYDPIGLNGFYEFIEDCTAVFETDAVSTAVYPNPTFGKVRIEAENIQNISIFNIHGEKVYEGSAKGDVFEYDLSHQAAGIYLIKVETTKGVETKRVTVL